VAVIGGFGLTPTAFAVAPLITQAKIPAITMAAATASITAQSPYMTRTSYTTQQVAAPIAEWAIKNGFKNAVTMVSDYGPGVDSETAFSEKFKALGGTIKANLRVPVVNPDFSAYLQRVGDEKPDMLFTFVPSGVGVALMNQFVERGLDKAGIKIVAEGGIVDDDILPVMPDAVVGIVTGYHYSAAHESPENKKFQADFKAANQKLRGNNMALGAYDGMQLIYEALKKTGGKSDGPALMAAMKGTSWTSPRGPISIDAETGDITQTIYMRRTEKVNGELFNVEFSTVGIAKGR
jgi:branched-chain amino acid transport system substrate-binding protein